MVTSSTTTISRETVEPVRLLLENEDVLTFDWSPGCSYDKEKKTWMMGAVGRIGAVGAVGPNSLAATTIAATEPGLPKAEYVKTIPAAFRFTISVPKGNFQLHDRIYDSIKAFVKSADNEHDVVLGNDVVLEQYKPTPYSNKRLKSEREVAAEEIHQRNKNLDIEFDGLCRRFLELGCNIDWVTGPKLEQIPDDWMETYGDPIYPCGSSITIMCHKDTAIYQALCDSNLPMKYYPKWFANIDMMS